MSILLAPVAMVQLRITLRVFDRTDGLPLLLR
jgi:hypothetical protein